MAFYSTQCEICKDSAKRCVQPQEKGGEGEAFLMFECDNEGCKLNIARQKGIKQLQSLMMEEELARERNARRPAPQRAKPRTGGRGSGKHDRYS
ncbi:MAG: hypothetical protein IJ234_08730 [Clostridia bacterium]|nr:hypothetical protein [Clostridia bacterium]